MSNKAPSLVLADDPLFDKHRSPGYHPERPERLEAARRAIESIARRGTDVERIAVREASEDELALAHSPAYLERLFALAGKRSALDADTYVAPSSIEAARRAAGATLSLVDAILGTGRSAGSPPPVGVGLLRPPGHHATRERGMGFCLLNNAALAALHALERGLRRVAIVDWDVHHGNGTQDIFWSDPRVLYVSLHQSPLYPGTGAMDEVGQADGLGYTVNVPLSPRATDATYAAAFTDVVIPALDSFGPELVLISAGYDAHALDPLAAMALTDGGFAWMADELMRFATARAGGRLALLLEGGYDLTALEGSIGASIDALLCAASGGPRPNGPSAEAAAISPRHRAEIDHARRITDQYRRD